MKDSLIEPGTTVLVNFKSGRQAEGIVNEWFDSATITSLDGSAAIHIPSVLESVESVQIELYAAPPPVEQPQRKQNIQFQYMAPSINEGYNQSRYENPFLRKAR